MPVWGVRLSDRRFGARRQIHVFYLKRDLVRNLSGNDVYRTNSLIILVKNMLCSRLHRQTGVILIIFSWADPRIRPGAPGQGGGEV